MSGYTVRVIDPAAKGHPYPHARCFFDVAESVSLALHEIGLRGNREIIFGANLLASYPEPIHDDALLFNMEAWSSPWMTEAYLDLLRRHCVLDYAEANVRWLQARGIDARHCPIGYHPHLTRLTLKPEAERDIDVLFYGGHTFRRHAIWGEIVRAVPQNVLWLTHDNWDMRDDCITRAKIVLNLHAYDDAPLEMARISFLLANRACVISEWADDKAVWGFVPMYRAADIPVECERWLANAKLRSVVAEDGFNRFSAMPQKDALLAALAPRAAA